MNKYIFIGLIVAGTLGIFATVQAANYGASIVRGALFGAVETNKLGSVEVYKLVDGKTTCYIVGTTAAISCVK